MLSSLTYSYALMYRQLRTDKHIECRLPTIERVNQFCWPFLFTLCTCALMDLQLGTDKHSWGFGSTGKKSHQRQFDTWVCACMLVLLCVGALHCVSSTDKRSHFCWFSSWVCVCVCVRGVCVWNSTALSWSGRAEIKASTLLWQYWQGTPDAPL